MDDIRDSFSKMKKKFKQRLAGRKRRPDGTGANPDEERTDSTTSLPQPNPHVVASEGYDREEDRADAAEERVSSMDRSPQPDGLGSVPACGNDNGKAGGKPGVDGEASQSYSHLHQDVGSGDSGELEGARPSIPTPPISHGGKPDSMRTLLF